MSASPTRRAFCALAALCGWPWSSILAGPRNPTPSVLIGVLSTGHNGPALYDLLDSQLRAKLSEFSAGLNILRREAGFSKERLAALTDEMLSLHPDVLICLDLDAAISANSRRHGSDPPIVFLGHDDPLAYHLIQSFARPGNNLTGVTTFRCVDGKMVEILADTFPHRKRIGYLLDSSVDNASCSHLAQSAAERLDLTLIKIDVAPPDFFQKIPEALAPLHLEAVIAPASAPLWQNRRAFVAGFNNLKLPVIYESELFLNEGGLLYYGPIRTNAMAQMTTDVRKILLGASAGDIPVEQPTLFELVINLRAPYADDYGISPSALRRADRILQ